MRQSIPATTRARALERVRTIIFQVLGDRDVRVYLFGSSVTGRVRRSSDIDIAIDPVRALPSALLAELRERLEESDVPYDVDIVDLSAASPEIRARVEREGARWRG
jgi:predicted nucleotidyltransferase